MSPGLPAAEAQASGPQRAVPTEESVRASLFGVDDPEVGVDIVNLGLLRGWTEEGDQLHLRITATSPACPVGPHIVDMAREALAIAFPDHDCSAELVWEPPWSPADMTDRAREWLGYDTSTHDRSTHDR